MKEMEGDEKSASRNDSARPWESYNTVYTTAKAGTVSRYRVNPVVRIHWIDVFLFKDFYCVIVWLISGVLPVLGMEGVDKEKVQRVVYEMSKGSKYFENEERKETYMKRKIESMLAQLAKLTPYDISNYQKVIYIRLGGEQRLLLFFWLSCLLRKQS